MLLWTSTCRVLNREEIKWEIHIFADGDPWSTDTNTQLKWPNILRYWCESSFKSNSNTPCDQFQWLHVIIKWYNIRFLFNFYLLLSTIFTIVEGNSPNKKGTEFILFDIPIPKDSTPSKTESARTVSKSLISCWKEKIGLTTESA